MATTPAGRALRALARAPIGVYGAGYGWLFGHRFLMLEHVGRRSGLPRYVVLEVVQRLPDDRYVVASGRGEAADWYRNVRRDPRVRVSVGRGRALAATARPLDQTEARTRLEEYRAQRPRTWRLLKPLLARMTGRPGQSDEELAGSVALVEFALEVRGRVDRPE